MILPVVVAKSGPDLASRNGSSGSALFQVQQLRGMLTCLRIVQSRSPRSLFTINRLLPNMIHLTSRCTIPRVTPPTNRRNR
jgi:hypothetical protein